MSGGSEEDACTISFETKLYNYEMAALFPLEQAGKEGSLSDGGGRVPLMSESLFLTERATLITWLQVM